MVKTIAVFGASGVGKTSMLKKFVDNKFETGYVPTAFQAYKRHYKIDGKRSKLSIADFGGQNLVGGATDPYMRLAQGFIFAYSITDKSSFEQMKNIYERFCRVRSGKPAPIVICGMKSDLDSQRAVAASEVSEFAKTIGAVFYETSAQTNARIEDVFIDLIRNIRKQYGSSKTVEGLANGKDCIVA